MLQRLLEGDRADARAAASRRRRGRSAGSVGVNGPSNMA
jgi:hypothetical protein